MKRRLIGDPEGSDWDSRGHFFAAAAEAMRRILVENARRKENGVQRVKLTDFGLARAVDDASLMQSGFIAGTPQYMSPEQANDEHVDHRSDLFSLGSVLYELCTGRPAFRAANTAAVLLRVSDEVPRPIREVNPDIPEALCRLIERLHAKKPADRPASAEDAPGGTNPAHAFPTCRC